MGKESATQYREWSQVGKTVDEAIVVAHNLLKSTVRELGFRSCVRFLNYYPETLDYSRKKGGV